MDKCTFQGVDYYIVDVDARGSFRNADAVLKVLDEELKDGKYTDVVVFSHGYNVKRETDGSLDMMNDVVPNMEAKRPADRRALYLSIKWPSYILTLFQGNNKNPKKLSKELIRMLAEAVGDTGIVSAAVAAPGVVSRSLFKHTEINLATLQEETELFLADAPDDDDEKANGHANVPSTTVITGSAPVHTSTVNGHGSGNGELPAKICDSIASLVNELNKQSEQEDGDDSCLLDDTECRYKNLTADRVRRRFEDIRAQNINPQAYNNAASNTAAKSGETQVASRSYTVIGTVLALKKAWDFTHMLHDLVFGTFERRASVIGSVGGHKLISEVQERTSSDVRVHLFGHSLGVHVMQSAAIGRGPPKQLKRKIHSILLAQGACPADSFGIGGPYRPIVSTLAPVAGPILNTVFHGDMPLLSYNFFYPKPLGRFGFDKNVKPFGVEEITIEPKKFPEETFKKRTCYNLMADQIISGHGDIGDQELMCLFWQAATIEMDAKDYEMTSNDKLPYGFWNDFDVRTEKSLSSTNSGLFSSCSLV